MRHWDAAYTQALSDYQTKDCITILYEDLCRDPDQELTRVASFLELKLREKFEQLEDRHKALMNSNAKYIAMHECAKYGRGVWDSLGYEC